MYSAAPAFYRLDCEPAMVSDSGLCRQCRDLNLTNNKFVITNIPQASGTSVVSKFDPVGFGSLELGFLDEIYANRTTCSLCRLIYSATHSDDSIGLGHDGLDMQGQRVSCSMEWHLNSRSDASGPSTRRLRVFSKSANFPEFYIVPIVPRNSEQPSHMATRRENRTLDFELFSMWYRSCSGRHEICSHAKESVGHTFRPRRLIDVHALRLCESDQEGMPLELSYAALSYCWGLTPFLKATQSTMIQLRQGFRIEELPRSIRDGIIVSRKLGIRFIWVDSLCIIQDSAQDWEQQFRQMDQIYEQASLTICVAAGPNAECGIPGVESTPIHPSQNEERYNGLNLTTLRPVSRIISSTSWDTRAWTFQERLLSRRCLISTPEGMIWQCKTTTWRDNIDSSLNKEIWTLDWVASPLKALQGNPLRSYTSCANIYSGRQLTYEKDRVAAFDGISAGLGRSLGSAFEYAMPLRYLDWALLWVVQDRNLVGRSERTTFPSWSWCGWNRPISWPVSSLEGTMFNLRDWFANRTWIIWYISPSPWELAWNADKQIAPSNPLNRWDGYTPGEHDCYGRSKIATGCRFRDKVKTGEVVEPSDYPYSLPKGYLLFQTFTGYFSLSRKTMAKLDTSLNEKGLYQFGIADNFGDWCGTVILDGSWYSSVGGVFEFAAISEAKDFSMEELDTWTYYVPEERQQAEWYCFYALMLRWTDTSNGLVAERVGLAKIFQSSFFSRSLKECLWKTILLC